MQETIIFALIERAQFAVNPAVYSKEPHQLLGLGDASGVAGNRGNGHVSPHNIPPHQAPRRPSLYRRCPHDEPYRPAYGGCIPGWLSGLAICIAA